MHLFLFSPGSKMAAPIAFVSHRTIEEKRDNKRKAQKLILDKAKEKYEKEERRQKQRQERGDDRWMLPSVSQSLDSKTKKRKKKEKKKHKKSKKHKRSKSSSSSDGDTDEEEEWVEAPSVVAPPATHSIEPPDVPSAASAGPQQTERDSWMESPFLTATYSSSEIRKGREMKRKEEKEKERSSIDNPGQSARELNPFWKDGGTGLPQEDPSKVGRQPNVGVGDGGSGWLRKSYERVKQQAKEEGRLLEELAAERWGSLEKIHQMLGEAEGSSRWPSGGWRKDDRRRGRAEDNERGRFIDRGASTDMGRKGDKSEEKHRDERGFRRPKYDDEGDRRTSTFKRPSEEQSPSRRSGYDMSRDAKRYEYAGDRSVASLKGQFRKPDQEGFSSRGGTERTKSGGLGSLKGQFRKPEENSGTESYKRSSSGSQSWRKPGHERPDRGLDQSERKDGHERTDRGLDQSKLDSGRDDKLRKNSSRNRYNKETSSRERPSSSEGEDSSGNERKGESHGGSRRREPSEDSSSSSSSSEEEEEQPVVLTKDEMNQLGAKIVKAEIMGNEELVKKLKQQLEAARKAGTARPQKPATKGRPEEVVILSRTNRMGQSYPLPEEAGEERPKKRKKKNRGVITHGKDGERERYFGDDDNVDLKTMVQREKMGLAEDQNNMFARAQARALKSLNDEYTLDDMFVSSASKQSDRDEVQRQKDRAIREHQKMEAALSRCPYCIDSPEMAKHLIVALGIKAYLCLPRTQSLTQGHCQIVPMHHSTACTALDEDVWNEIQIFRKGLTKMFEDHNKDAVFIEYSSDSKRQRHMVLDCIPLPRDCGELAPIYFKKAIQESETEWSQNKKLIDTREKDIRHSVPKGFPYFSVDFGLDGGFAHVIEDHQLFPHYFGKEVLGGLLDVEPRLWRNPPKENFDSQRKKVMEFGEWWKPFDWTKRIDRENT